MDKYIKLTDAIAITNQTGAVETKKRLKELAAADVRAVVRGTWTRIDHVPCGHDYVCSVCGFKNDARRNYCPDCGAVLSG